MSMGLCITPEINPSTIEQEEMNAPYYRSILYSLEDMLHLLDLVETPLVITLNNQCAEVGGDWSGWDHAIYSLMEMLKAHGALDRLAVLGCGNELDLYWSENRSTPPEFAADITRRAYRIAKNYGKKVSATSLAGPEWPHYLNVLSTLLGNDVDFYDMHPYGQKPEGWKDGTKWMHGNLVDVIQHIQSVTGKSVIVTEYGVKIGDAGNEQEVANFLEAADQTLESLDVVYKCWFAYHDLVGAPSERGRNAFGLISTSNIKRPAYESFSNINKGVIVVPPDELEKWKAHVGFGLLEMMKADNTVPAMASEWRPFDRPPKTPATIEQCIGLNNVTYCWNLNTNSGWRIRPSQ